MRYCYRNQWNYCVKIGCEFFHEMINLPGNSQTCPVPIYELYLATSTHFNARMTISIMKLSIIVLS